MNLERKLALIKANEGKVFSVEFLKKDGTLRKMTCRLGVTKYLRGGNNTCVGHQNLVTVFDIVNKGYRNINLDTILSMRSKGEVYVFK